MAADMRDKIAEVIRNGYFHDTANEIADAVMAVVTPELERLRADRIVSCVFAVRSGECPLPFALYRRTDETGVSGEGTVAYGVQFADGTVVIRWLGDYASTVVWDDLEKAMQVHGHRGSTRVVWLAEQFEDLAEIEAKAERAEQAEVERDALKATTERIRRAVVDVYGEDYGGEDIAAEVERLFGHLSEHDVNMGRLIGAKNEALERAEAGRAALKAEMEVQRAIVAEFDQVATEKGAERDALKAARNDVAEAIRQASRIMTCHSRDWSLDAADAWLYALLVGWDCEIAEHADGSHDPIDCGGPNHLENFAERFGWTEGGIAKLRAQRQAIAALDTPTPTEETRG